MGNIYKRISNVNTHKHTLVKYTIGLNKFLKN